MEMVWLFSIASIFAELTCNSTAAPTSTSKVEGGLGASTWLGDCFWCLCQVSLSLSELQPFCKPKLEAEEGADISGDVTPACTRSLY